MVSTPHSVASAAAIDALRRGGSAVDAAIAANATLCVAYPHMAGLGGDGFWLLAGDGDGVRGINASGPAAADASRSYYAERDSIPDRGAESALTVPGAVDGWRLAHEAHGTLPWADLFDDAISLATGGVVVSSDLARWIRADRDVLAADPNARRTFLHGGDAPEAGRVLEQPELASSFRAIARDGARGGFYEGPLAAAITDPIRADGSPLQPSDFGDYTAEWVDPISVEYRGYTAHSLPPNTQGIAALQILGLLEGFDVAGWGDGTPAYHHGIVEATKLAFADRDAWVADPEFVDVPTDRLLSAAYLDDRRNRINPQSTLSPSPDPGLSPGSTSVASEPPEGDTCYFTVVDEDGLAVSAIQSIYYDFGSAVVAGDTGIVPQNRGSFFSLDPTHVNSLEPGKRPFHTLIPSMLTKNGEPKLTYGTMGGEGQPQTQAAVLSRIVDFGYDPQRAIEAPRWLFGRTWGETSRSLTVESRVPDGVVEELRARGHRVSIAREYDDVMGHAQAIKITDEGVLEGGADPRGDGAAIGY